MFIFSTLHAIMQCLFSRYYVQFIDIVEPEEADTPCNVFKFKRFTGFQHEQAYPEVHVQRQSEERMSDTDSV